MNTDSKFQFNGTVYTWTTFKLQYQFEWDLEANPQNAAQDAKNMKFYENLWSKAGRKICEHYTTAHYRIDYLEYTEENIKKQKYPVHQMRPAHYIIAIDQSYSMGG